jgi:hypothetical protein
MAQLFMTYVFDGVIHNINRLNCIMFYYGFRLGKSPTIVNLSGVFSDPY